MAIPKTIFITDEKRAWMRLRSHTVVFERDPEFSRYLEDESGSVLSMLRIWVSGSGQEPRAISHYLGSVRYCECGGWMSRLELYRLFRQATTVAGQIGERAATFRTKLSELLRHRFGKLKQQSA